MRRELSDVWQDHDEETQVKVRRKKGKSRPAQEEEEPGELQEWREELGKRGRKPPDLRRPRHSDEDEDS